MSDSKLKLTVLGGGSEIGASCILVEVGETRLLIDCGVRFNPENALPDLSLLHGKHLDAIVLTHAHSDHTGGLPVVCDAFPDVPVYATPPTQEIAMILLGDALKLMNKDDRETEVPLYAEKQVAHLAEVFRPVHHGDTVPVRDAVLTFLPAGHILGASMVHLATPAGNVLFTGDYSVSSQHTVPALSRPQLHTDMVVTEATYGDRLHEDRDAAELRFVERIREVVDANGRVLIPAFAVGRAQEVLLILKRALRNKRLPEIPVYVDGMVRAVCNIYSRHDRYISRTLFHEIRKAGHPFYTNGIEPIERPQDRAAALEKGACIIVASSGMLSGGASVTYASAILANENDAILITGYQDEESPGRALLNLADAGSEREIKLAGRVMPVKCRFEKYGLSAHADRMQMVGLIESLRPRTVVLVHGDLAAKNALAGSLGAGDVVLADNGRSVTRTYPVRRTGESRKREMRKLDLASARQLLGPAGGPPVRAKQVAEAWYGRGVNAETADRFAMELEHLGLVRRDDQRRQLLYVLSPSETDIFPAEAALENALKEENPKGKLIELAMRQRIAAPEFVIKEDGPFYTAIGSMQFDGVRFESGPHSAAVKRTAEQLAARALLREIEKRTSLKTVVTQVTDAEASALKAENPKGRLLEWCTANSVTTPRFELKADVNGYCAEAAITLADKTMVRSGVYCAATKKVAEQAAANALLDKVRDKIPEKEEVLSKQPEEGIPPAESVVSGRDPMMLLNEMRQLGLLKDFGYDIDSVGGSSHQPTFSIVGWAVLESDEEVEAEPIEATAKKTGRRLAAEMIIKRLKEIGMLAAG
jgi:Cft2 family RNA processing exonuclease